MGCTTCSRWKGTNPLGESTGVLTNHTELVTCSRGRGPRFQTGPDNICHIDWWSSTSRPREKIKAELRVGAN